MRFKKINKKIALAVPILLGIFVLSGYFLWKNNREEIELIQVFEERAREAEEIDTSDWKTYRNGKYGFQFSYPNNWQIVIKEYL